MKFFLSFFFFFSSSIALFSHVAVTENEPSVLVEGIVNVITGDLYALEDDIVVQAAEPIRLRRSYISSGGEGQWRLFESHTATLLPLLGILYVREPNGTTLAYRSDFKEWFQKKKKHKKNHQITFHPLHLGEDAQGLANTARGNISAHTNLKNQYILMDDTNHFTVICPNGTKRTYRAAPNQEPEKIKLKGALHGKMKVHTRYNYLLKSEELPNGNYILYHWNNNALYSIQTTNPYCQIIYAEATIHFKEKNIMMMS